MRIVATPHQRRIVIAVGCAALVCLLELGGPAAGHAQPSSRDRVLHELWNTYPLEPRTGEARLRSENQPDGLHAQLPRSGGTPAGRSTGFVGGRPSGVGDGSSAPLPLSVLVLALVGLIAMVLVVRSAAKVGRRMPGSVARFGSAVVSPVRSLATVSRPNLAGTFRAGATVGAGLGRTGGVAARLPLRVGAAVGAVLRSTSVGIFSKSGEILLYALVAAASVAVGVGVTLLLSAR
jgi:hypothetical protein